MVVLKRKLDRPLGVPDSASRIAAGQGLSGTVQLDQRRETAVFPLIGNDHSRRDVRFLIVAYCWLQPPLGIPQAALDSLEFAAYQQYPGKVDAEHRPDLDHFVRERLELATHLGLLPGPPHCQHRQLDQVGCSLEIPGGQRVADGLGRLAVVLVPSARPPVQVRHLAGLFVQQPRLQHICKQMVVAIPPAAVIQRNQEQVPPVQRLQHALATTLPGDGIA
jgi:hypothetical protein